MTNPKTRFFVGFLLGVSLALQAETELEKAAHLIKGRNYPEAQLVLDRAVQADPRNAEAYCLLGELQFIARNHKKAVEYADKAILLNSAKASYQLLRGRVIGNLAQQVNMVRAMTMVGDIRGAFEKAVQLEPKNREARSYLFLFYLQTPGIAGGGLDKAKAFTEQTQSLDAAQGHYFKGLVLRREKNPGSAQAEYRLAIAADPHYAVVYNDLGGVELEFKQVDLAIEHFRKQVELTPEDANSWDSLGEGWLAKGNLDESIKAYRKALSLDPLFTYSLRGLGKALEQAGRRDEAIQHYRQCAQLGGQKGIPRMVTESHARLKALGVKD